MGLNYPLDIDAWAAWQKKQNALRWAKTEAAGFFRRNRGNTQQGPASGRLYVRGSVPRVLIVLDSFSPTSCSALLEPLKYLSIIGLAIWCPNTNGTPAALAEYLTDEWEERSLSATELTKTLPGVRIVLSLGHYLQLGRAAYQYAHTIGAEYWVVQHGLLVPAAPPLPVGCTLLAFSDADAEFWMSGRRDVRAFTVGSQLLYNANQKSLGVPVESSGAPIFLGQMHGAELPRSSYVNVSYRFIKKHNAIYRPHPSETDKLSTLTHALWERQGIPIDRSGVPLNELPNPVVSIFSTGVLEAAIRGIPAWVYHPNPPGWLEEFWNRYGMGRWGEDRTPAPPQPDIEPARRIAELIIEHSLEA